jgi:hypothetical protein
MAPLFICGMNIETCTNENPVVYGGQNVGGPNNEETKKKYSEDFFFINCLSHHCL